MQAAEQMNGNIHFDIREYTPGRGTEREARVYRWHPAREALSHIATVYVHGEAEPRNGVEAYATAGLPYALNARSAAHQRPRLALFPFDVVVARDDSDEAPRGRHTPRIFVATG